MKRTISLRKLLLSLSLAAGVFCAPAYAQVSFSVNIAPPAPRYEVVPAIAPGYVWAPGYWGWAGDRHVWIRGRSIVQRSGYNWEPDRWEQRNSGYYRTAGHWARDNDRRGDRGHGNNGNGRGNKHER